MARGNYNEPWNKLNLTPGQQAWLIKHFPNTDNYECAEHLGMSVRTVIRRARELNLQKGKAFIKNAQREAAAAAKYCNEKSGRNAALRGKPVPGGEAYRFKPGETSRQRLGFIKDKMRIAKSASTRRETFARERERVRKGLPQKTRLNVHEAPKAAYGFRNMMRRRGYIIERGSWTATATPDTRRSNKTERTAARYGITIKIQD